MRYLRNKKDGFIYEWDPILAENPLCEEVTEQEAFPERFIPEKAKGRKSKLMLETNDTLPEELDFINEALNAEASRGLP